jgi:hypothetical protein
VPAGENVSIRGDDGQIIFTYRSFASVVPLVALVVAVVVIITGLGAVAFLLAEGRPVPAVIAFVLSSSFAVLIAMLVPTTNVTLHHANTPVLTLMQQSNVSFPVATYVVATPDRKVLARFRRSIWSRLGRNRWKMISADHDNTIGLAIEESLSRALMSKVAGKFHPRYESNVRVEVNGNDAAWIVRRPNTEGEADLLEITGTIDPRVAVGLATLILGSEP